jgi:spore coat polysaccharide biosynthesis protein SpsF
MSKKINLSIEARTTSSRLPGKVLKKINDIPMLQLLIEKCKKSSVINEIIVSTTINSSDDLIFELSKKLNVNCFRGSELDVLGRVCNTHIKYKTDIVVELTGDNPLQDPLIIDYCVKQYLDNNVDFVNNGALDNSRTYPDGMDVAVFSIDTLIDVEKKTRDHNQAIAMVKNKSILKKSYQNNDNRFREHVILFIKTSGLYSTLCVHPNDPYLKRPELSFTVDTLRDFQFIEKITEKFDNIDFSLKDIIKVIDTYKINH